MALIVGGVTVTGTQTLDATKLTGDLPAISAANLTSIPAGSSIPVVSLGVVHGECMELRQVRQIQQHVKGFHDDNFQ